MLGLFKKKIALDETWILTAQQARLHVVQVGAIFGEAAIAVNANHVIGWRSVEDTLRGLESTDATVKNIGKLFKAVGQPTKDSPYAFADTALKEFIAQVSIAVYWGKHHYSDASGDPGERALTETGFAQRAALKRINNNGSKFADAASSASVAAAAFVEQVSDGQ